MKSKIEAIEKMIREYYDLQSEKEVLEDELKQLTSIDEEGCCTDYKIKFDFMGIAFNSDSERSILKKLYTMKVGSIKTEMEKIENSIELTTS